jgi:hypothetical protein
MLLMTEKSILVGHKWVVALIVIGALSAFSSLMQGLSDGKVVVTMLRTALTAWCFWSMYFGKGWARWLMVILHAITGSMLFKAGIDFFRLGFDGGSVIIFFGLFNLSYAAALAFLKPVNDYYAYTAKI